MNRQEAADLLPILKAIKDSRLTEADIVLHFGTSVLNRVKNIPIIEAWIVGNIIELFDKTEWRTHINPYFIDKPEHYRIKTGKKKKSGSLLGAKVRFKNLETTTIITSVNEDRYFRVNEQNYSYEELKRTFTYLDGKPIV